MNAMDIVLGKTGALTAKDVGAARKGTAVLRKKGRAHQKDSLPSDVDPSFTYGKKMSQDMFVSIQAHTCIQ
jgi:hypothetical protein